MKPRWKKLILIAPFAIVGLLLFVAAGGAAVMLLWNWLLPALFGWPVLSFWQALGILALCRILFGGSGPSGGSMRSNMRRRLDERCERMTPEERERFRHGMRARWGFGPSAGEGKEGGANSPA